MNLIKNAMNKTRITFKCCAIGMTLIPLSTVAQHSMEQHQLEEVFVTGDMQKSAAETALPIDALSGEALRKALRNSLGQTLENQLGVSYASFGAGVGLPVIRGQSGPRVSVIQNGLGAMDAASASPDHSNSIDPLVAERIEVIRGPATLLYGNGAIGGVVNVVDNRIPEILPDGFEGAVEVRHDSAAAQDAGAFKVTSSLNTFAWHLDGAYRDSGDTKIPGYAIDESSLEQHDDETGHEDEEAHIDEPANSFGHIANSDSRASSLAAGGSWIGERGFAGFSVSRLKNDYGLPPGSHLHREEHEQENGAAPEEEEHTETEDIRIDLQQTRYEFKTALDVDGFFTRLNARVAYNDYAHVEYATGEHDADHEEPEQHDRHDTRFTNRGFETRFTAQHDHGKHRNGVAGAQWSNNEFAVTGEEGFIPRTDINSAGIFMLESVSSGSWIYELGARLQRVELNPEHGCSRTDTSWSASAAAIWQVSETINTSLSLSRAQRSAGVEERYSNVDSQACAPFESAEWKVHNPTDLIEVGNPDLREETSNNLELSLHKHLGEVHGEISIYFNRANDYIYLAETGQDVDGVPVALYQQDDAEFHGYEAELTLPIRLALKRHLEVTLFSDAVYAELTSGEYLPRIPPSRTGIDVSLVESQWSINLRASRVAQASNLAPSETPTDGYTLVDITADYHFEWGNNDVLLFATGSNLLEESIRKHTSFAKSLAPEPGRGIRAGIRVTF